VARHGGEEFVIVMPGADIARSAPILHRLRERLAGALADAQLPTFTVSLGLVDSSSGNELNELIKLADRALMRAKSDGRDRVVIWDPSIGTGSVTDADPSKLSDQAPITI
jgi:diguanylate cyclase (GGDEF)-like protein